MALGQPAKTDLSGSVCLWGSEAPRAESLPPFGSCHSCQEAAAVRATGLQGALLQSCNSGPEIVDAGSRASESGKHGMSPWRLRYSFPGTLHDNLSDKQQGQGVSEMRKFPISACLKQFLCKMLCLWKCWKFPLRRNSVFFGKVYSASTVHYAPTSSQFWTDIFKIFKEIEKD